VSEYYYRIQFYFFLFFYCSHYFKEGRVGNDEEEPLTEHIVCVIWPQIMSIVLRREKARSFTPLKVQLFRGFDTIYGKQGVSDGSWNTGAYRSVAHIFPCAWLFDSSWRVCNRPTCGPSSLSNLTTPESIHTYVHTYIHTYGFEAPRSQGFECIHENWR